VSSSVHAARISVPATARAANLRGIVIGDLRAGAP
jgi:hypothetical protein